MKSQFYEFPYCGSIIASSFFKGFFLLHCRAVGTGFKRDGATPLPDS